MFNNIRKALDRIETKINQFNEKRFKFLIKMGIIPRAELIKWIKANRTCRPERFAEAQNDRKFLSGYQAAIHDLWNNFGQGDLWR